MASARTLAATITGLALGWTAVAHAKTTLHATGSVSAAYTDNANADTALSGGSAQEPVRTPFFLLTPGLLLEQDNRTTNYSLSYYKSLSYFLNLKERNDDSDIVAGEGRFELSANDVLSFRLSGTRSSVSSLLLDFGGSNADTVEAVGFEDRVRVDLSQSWAHLLNERWSFVQSTGVGGFASLDANERVRWRLSEEIAFDYTLPRDTYRLSVSGGYLQGGDTGSGNSDVLHQFVVESQLRWRHQLAENWASTVGAGANFSKVVGGLWGIAPAAEASLGFEHRAFNARLAYGHQRQFSLETGSIFESDQGSLDAGVMLSREHSVSWTSGAALARHKELSFDDRLGELARVKVFSAETRVNWALRLAQVSLSYAHLRQFDSSLETRPDFFRNVFMLTVSGFFPEKQRPAPSSLKRIEAKPRGEK